jgi:hypothetical protein
MSEVLTAKELVQASRNRIFYGNPHVFGSWRHVKLD